MQAAAIVQALLAQGAALELIGSALVVLVLIGLAALLGFRLSARVDVDALQRLATEENVRIAEAALSSDGHGALALLADGRLMAVRVMGLDVSARIFPSGAVTLRQRRSRIRAVFADTGYPGLDLRLAAVPDWLAVRASTKSSAVERHA